MKSTSQRLYHAVYGYAMNNIQYEVNSHKKSIEIKQENLFMTPEISIEFFHADTELT